MFLGIKGTIAYLPGLFLPGIVRILFTVRGKGGFPLTDITLHAKEGVDKQRQRKKANGEIRFVSSVFRGISQGAGLPDPGPVLKEASRGLPVQRVSPPSFLRFFNILQSKPIRGTLPPRYGQQRIYRWG